MHGFFLLHGKVSLSRRFIVALSALLQYWFIDQPSYRPSALHKHSADACAFSFIKILNLMQNMSYPPQMLFVENVVGFEVGINFIWSFVFVFVFNNSTVQLHNTGWVLFVDARCLIHMTSCWRSFQVWILTFKNSSMVSCCSWSITGCCFARVIIVHWYFQLAYTWFRSIKLSHAVGAVRN